LLRDGEIRVRSVVKLAEPIRDEDGEEREDDLEESVPSEDEAELLKRVLKQLTRLERTCAKIDELLADYQGSNGAAGAQHAEAVATVEKLNARLLEGLREIPLNPMQTRIVVDEIRRAHQRVHRHVSEVAARRRDRAHRGSDPRVRRPARKDRTPTSVSAVRCA